MGAAEGKWTKRLRARAGRAGDGGAWPPGAAELLRELLEEFPQLSRHTTRLDLLDQMDEAAGRLRPDGQPPGVRGRFGVVVREEFEARAHLRALVRAVEARPDPGLAALRLALRDIAPHDRALPWLELAVLGLTGSGPLPAAAALTLLRGLRACADPPAPAQLARHVPYDVPGTALLTGRETLPEILLRLSDLRVADPGRSQPGRSHPGRPDPGGGEGGDAGNRAPLLRFLGSVAADGDLAAYVQQVGLRALLAPLAPLPGPPAGHPPAGAERLIVQIRVEAAGPEHVEDRTYELRGAYYRQPLDGGPMRRVAALPPSEPFRRSELTGAGSARMSAWTELAREVRGAGGGVRVEFLLPRDLLGHSAELWSAGPSRMPLGQHHPVVVRSLDRYIDFWLDLEPWRQRWRHLWQDPPGGGGSGGPRDGDGDVLERIEWPPLDAPVGAELVAWLALRPALACIGLTVPYDRLPAHLRKAVVDEALIAEGVPVLLWRRDPGDPDELVSALRTHPPARLRDLPETVHRCRKHGRAAGAQDVRNNITLLWDDPDCVDADQDPPYAGMA